jgi:hypothetical protein
MRKLIALKTVQLKKDSSSGQRIILYNSAAHLALNKVQRKISLLLNSATTYDRMGAGD